MALDRLAQRHGARPGDEPTEHALLFHADLRDNRRALARLLKARFQGDASFVERHPVSRSWFRAHRRIDPELWMRGIRLRRTPGGGQSVELRIEIDPLQILKMGSYVGSCLGLGGGLGYAAAAVALDVNKRVVYARDDRGAVHGRQLLALSEDERLVCFQVYPRSAGADLQRSFRDYDRDFARALGVEMHDVRRDPDAPDVLTLLSQSWWDDGAWDLKVSNAGVF